MMSGSAAASSAQNTSQAAAAGTETASGAAAPDPAAAQAAASAGAAASGAKTNTEPKKAPEAAAYVVPEKYDLKLPDGSLLNPGVVDEVSAFAKEQKLSQPHAQMVLDQRNKAIATFMESNQRGGSEWNKRVDAWEAANLSNKEIGGSKEALAANAELGKRFIEKFFPPEMKQFLNDSGFGSHPSVMRGFVKLGKLMAEDKLFHAGAQGGSEKQSMADVFYGKKKEA